MRRGPPPRACFPINGKGLLAKRRLGLRLALTDFVCCGQHRLVPAAIFPRARLLAEEFFRPPHYPEMKNYFGEASPVRLRSAK